jgi:hypothetical protein
MQNNDIELLSEYIHTANKFGWYSYKLLFFTIKHWKNKRLRSLIAKSRAMYHGADHESFMAPPLLEADIKAMNERNKDNEEE